MVYRYSRAQEWAGVPGLGGLDEEGARCKAHCGGERESELGGRSKRALARERKAAEEEGKSALEQWSEAREAVGKVEDDMEVDDTAAAMSQVEIGQKQPWESDLVDRTKD